LIAGAGPVGLALAVELSSRGVSCVVADAGDDRRGAPRAKLTNVRSMEHMRRWGLAKRLRDVAPLDASYSTDIVFVTRLTGRLLTRFTDVFATGTSRRDEFPERAQQVPQYLVEDVLREAVDASPLVTRRTARLEGFEERDGGVRVDLSDGPCDAGYLVGCDGGRSTVRSLLGATMEGRADITRNLGIVFRAPGLAGLHPHGSALHYWLVNRDAPGFMGPLDGDTWWMIATAVEAAEHDPRAMVEAAIGSATDLEIVGIDPWRAHALIASRQASRRVFLAGDAAHLHPPFGAHGMNMGLGDAVDLGWKLAATLAGWGGPALLASYEPERRPLHERIVAEAALNNERLAHLFVTEVIEDDTPAGDTARTAAAAAIQEAKLREFHSLGLVLGFDLSHSPLVVGDGTPAPPADVTTYVPTARPGHLLPHAWLPDGRSLYDALKPWFTVLDLGGDPEPFVRAAAALGVPLDVVRHDADLGAPLVLVRPDRLVAWRGEGADAEAVLRQATGR
jgi:2-polyprenyl-6-methoxyphenol hydroxylase-like FAD-dependent oxidoreductase